MAPSLSGDDVRAAAERLAGVAHRTPVLTSTTLDGRAGARVFLKCENFQRTGAFKFRGAYNAVSLLSEAQRRAGVITFSSGNHGQALALAARLHHVPATIVMPGDAPDIKIAATRGYGADVVFYERRAQDREAVATKLARERGLVLIPPFDDPRVIAGQGTATMELFEDVGELDYLLVPLGGGGLLAGAALAAQASAPGCKLIGVEPQLGNDGQQSLRSNRIVQIPVPDTIADGARTTHLGRYTFPIIRERVTDIVTASDAELVEAMRFLAERMKIMVEPTGALAVAAVFQHIAALETKRVGVLISGGNIDARTFCRLTQA